MIDLSISIVNYNAKDLLQQCLHSIFSNVDNLNIEVWVVDNASIDGSAEMVESMYPQVNLIKNSSNRGFIKANNQGLRKSNGRYVLSLNNDTIVLPGALSTMVEFMDSHPDAGAIGAKLLNPDGTLQLSCRDFPTYSAAIFNRYSLLTKLFPNNKFSRKYLKTDWDHNDVREVDWVSGSCLLVRREVIETVGIMDEDYNMYVDDVDWCYRIWKHGWKVYYVPDAKIIHYIGMGGTHVNPPKMTIERHKSMYKFYKKHYSKNPLLDYLVLSGIAARAGGLLLSYFVKQVLQ